MRRAHRLVSLGVLLAFTGVLCGCSSSLSNLDPSDLLDFLDTKKKLPGERKAVFPEGVPGLQPGVPKEMYKGAKAEPDAALPAEPVEEARVRKPAKSRSASRAAPPSPRQPKSEPEIAPDDVSVEETPPPAAAAPPPEARQRIVRRRTTAPPPDQPAVPPAQPAAPAQQAATPAPFPAPLPSNTFSR